MADVLPIPPASSRRLDATTDADSCLIALATRIQERRARAVIPTLKLTNQGLVDVERFEIVPLWVG